MILDMKNPFSGSGKPSIPYGGRKSVDIGRQLEEGRRTADASSPNPFRNPNNPIYGSTRPSAGSPSGGMIIPRGYTPQEWESVMNAQTKGEAERAMRAVEAAKRQNTIPGPQFPTAKGNTQRGVNNMADWDYSNFQDVQWDKYGIDVNSAYRDYFSTNRLAAAQIGGWNPRLAMEYVKKSLMDVYRNKWRSGYPLSEQERAFIGVN